MTLHDRIEALMLKQDDANHIVWAAVLCTLGTVMHSLPAGWLLSGSIVIGKEFLVDADASFRDICFGAVGIALVSAGALPGIIPALFK